jgi:hypothetical protein
MVENELIKIDEIKNRIFTIRGMQVILDRDIARFYSVKTIKLREQVKRNIKRFPSDFMFQLTEIETDFMVSQNAIPSKRHLGGFLPYVFTEQGVASVSSVITSDKAIEISVLIMRAFVAMRHFLADKVDLFKRVDFLEIKQLEADNKFKDLFKAMESNKLLPRQGIFFDGQVFDAHKFVSDIVRSAEKSIILIDNYVDDTVLTLFSKRKDGVVLKILTKNPSKQLQLDIKKFNEQFPPAEIKEFNHSHDRFMIIDNRDLYHFGASLKDLGRKWFGFSKMEVDVTKMVTKLL